MRRRLVWLAVASVALGLMCLAYAGPGRAFVRGHVGDVAAAMLVHALFGLGRPSWSLRARTAATLAVALAVEAGQLAWSPLGRSTVGALTIGSVFDPRDLVAYVAGALVGAAWQRPGASLAQPAIAEEHDTALEREDP
jgi:Protein of unknown function (DUF2809)